MVAGEACDGIGRNQACYGHAVLEAEPQEGISDWMFEQEGDRVGVATLYRLRTSAMDLEEQTWGMALLSLQANLPDTLPGQNVMLLLFGDAEITNAVENTPPPVLLDVTATGNPNVRSGPSTDYAVVGSLAAGQTVVGDGHDDTGNWLRIRLESGRIGWVYAPLVTITGDMTTLPTRSIIDDTEPEFGPMQAFYFRSDVGDALCNEAPNSGLLVQTPDGAGEISLMVNEVRVRLGSTAYLWMPETNRMNISVIEGQAEITTAGVTVMAIGGEEVSVLLDENGLASEAPSEPETLPVDFADPLPMSLLPRSVAFVTEAVFDGGSPAPLEVTQSTCVVSTNTPVNARRGPGVEFPADTTFYPDDQRTATQKASTPDGTWYFLGDFWVREDVVNETGDCESLPALLPVDYPTNHWWFIIINDGCSVNNGQSYIRAGEILDPIFLVDEGNVPESELGNTVRGFTPVITIDGVYREVTEIWVARAGSSPIISTARAATWRVPPGTHTLTATWGSHSASCSFTAYNG
ncbi:MAG: SH3 domain-containing protein [Anaerolineae bacterium]|nr:SH3 domain-containing protein [Anaerolineae bacterium]